MYQVTATSILSQEFLEKYEGKQPQNKGILFELIYLRTYSRFVEEWKRRETWNETVQRVVEYIFRLYSGHKTIEQLRPKAEKIFDSIFNLKLLPSGRALWIGGTAASERSGESCFNCTYTNIEKISDFYEVFYLLLCGCGVGFSVEKKFISKLPNIYGTTKKLVLEEYRPVPKDNRKDSTVCKFSDDLDTYYITVGDSKEGWAEALEAFLTAYCWNDEETIVLNFDNVRGKGERIKTFGGFAPGPEGLMEMFRQLGDLFSSIDGKLSSIQVLDVILFVAKHVPSGGTRRAALIGFGDRDDHYFINCKNLECVPAHREMSNNSVVYEYRPSKEELKEIFERISNNGEPGFFNRECAQKKRPNVVAGNPCLEILMDNKGVCNLSTVFWTSHIKDNRIDIKGLLESVELATFIGCCMTNVDISLPEWDRVQKRDRLLGVSFTGFMDALDEVGLKFNDHYTKALLGWCKHAANDAADKTAFELRIPRPLLVTANKPEGTLSQLSTVSSGIHRSFSPYYIRRVSYAHTDPVAKVLLSKGAKYVINPKKSERYIFEFPIKTKAKTSANDEPALDQFDRYEVVMDSYTDHNVSCTLTFDPATEKELLIDKVDEKWDKIVAVAFLPKSNHGYKFAPYEQITEEEYNKRAGEFPDISDLVDRVNEIEKSYYEFELEESCVGGFCPPR